VGEERRGPLAGVRVVEIAQYVAAPMGLLALADLGADVVKVETGTKGDAFRTYGLRHAGFSALWLNVNRGKRSVALDLNNAAEQARCRRLIAAADVVVISSKPGALDDRGLDDASLAALKPELVRVYVTGYGPTGPRANEPVYDHLIQAMTGLMTYQGGADAPDVVAAIVADKTSAAVVTQAVLAALVERGRTGVGRRVDVSMLDAIAYWNFPDLYQDRTFLDDDRRLTRMPSPIVATSDGRIVVSPVTGSQIGRAAAALGHAEWVDELKRIGDHTAMVAELFRLIGTATPTMTTAAALALFAGAGVPAAPVLDLDEHLAEPQVVDNELYDEVTDPAIGRVRTVRYPASFDGQRLRAAFTAPACGADTDAVLEEWLGAGTVVAEGER